MRCGQCGTENSAQVSFCVSCGNALPLTADEQSMGGRATLPARTRPTVVSFLAVLLLVGAGLALLATAALVALATLGNNSEGVLIVVGVLSVAFGAIGAVALGAGIGMWRLKSYGRTLLLVLCVPGLLSFPFGTIVSIAILVYLYKPGVVVLFSGKSREQLTEREAADLAAVHRGSTVTVVVLLAVVLVSVLFTMGVIATVAMPTLIRARNRGNETTAIGMLRTIHRAQLGYLRECRGFASTLEELGNSGFLSPDMASSEAYTSGGYLFTIERSAGAEPVANAPAKCRDAMTDYFARGTPATPGTTGSRYFAVDGLGTIVSGAAPIENPIPPAARPIQQ